GGRGGGGGTRGKGGGGPPPAGGPRGGPPPGPAEPAPGGKQSEPGRPAGGNPAQPGRQPVLVGYGVKPGATTRRPRKPSATRPASYPATPPEGLREIVPPAGGPRGQGGVEGPRGDGGREPPMPGGPRGVVPPGQQSRPPGANRVLAKPPVRKLAKDLGVDLAALTGSGPEGSVTREDVQRAAGDATVRSGYESPVSDGGRPAVATA